jgi:hypothetical protein
MGNRALELIERRNYVKGLYLENNLKTLCKHIPIGHYILEVF